MDDAAALIGNGETEKAKPLLEENILAGCTDSMVLLGTVLSNGTEDERARSIALFREAAELGNSSGMRNLAYCYAIGLNVEKNKKKGAELYTKAAEMGNARAACNIGVMLDYGNGVEQNFEEAFLWYLRSAQGGCTRGMTNLGEYYLWGKGTEKNIHKAEEWFIRSASPRAFYRLSEIYLDAPGFIDVKKGRECLIHSAELGYSRAMFKYGTILETENKDKAVDFYNQAAMKGNQDAATRLEALGLPVPEPTFRKRKKKD